MAPRPETERLENDGNGRGSPLNGGGTLRRTPLPHSEVSCRGQANIEDDLRCKVSQQGSASDIEEESDPKIVPPDGGWGWAVLLGTMIVNIVVIGHAKSFGVYFRNVMEEFDASPSKVAWLQALQISMFSFLSPVASILSQIVGPRKVALCGGLMACAGLTMSAFTPNLQFLYISYGVIQGIALTCTFTPGITMIAKYFHRRRGLANGLAIAGNALGGTLMPLVVDRLITEYSLRGCYLIMGSILLNACVGAMLWQPVEWHQKKAKSKTTKIVSLNNSLTQFEPMKKSESFIGPILFQKNELLCDNCPTSMEYLMVKAPKTSLSEPDLYSYNSMDVDDLVCNGIRPSLLGLGSDQHSDHSNELTNGKIHRGSSSPHLGEYLKNNDRTYGSSNSTESLPILHKLSPGILNLRPSSRTTSFIYLSSYNLGPTAGAVLTKEHFTETDSVLYKTTSIPSIIANNPEIKKRKSWLLPCFKNFAIDRTIFEQSRFYIMTVSLFFHVLGYPGTLMFLPYRATMLGLSQAHAASLLSVLALTDLTGRICCAWLSDFHICPRKYWFIGGMFMSGVFAFSLPYYKTYATLLAGTAGFGFFCGAYIGLVVVMFADTYGPEKVALAYSISTVSGGFMALSGPPFMGYVLESTGSYVVCQCILGSAQFAGAAVWVAEPWAVRLEKKRREMREKTKSPEEEQLV